MRRPTLLLIAALATWGGLPLTAQEPDTLPEASPEALPDTAVPPVPAYVPPRYALSLTIGRPGGGTFQTQPVLVTTHGADAAPDSALLQRTVETSGGLQLGASAVVGLGSVWAVRLGAGVGRVTVEPRYDEGDASFVAAATEVAAGEATQLSTLFVEAVLRMRLLSSRRAQPYLELGASSLRWMAASAPGGSPVLPRGTHRLAATAAVGALIPFSDRLSARVHVETRSFRTPVAPSPAGTLAASSATTSIVFAVPPIQPFTDAAHELVSLPRLDVGISMRIGDAPRRPPDSLE